MNVWLTRCVSALRGMCVLNEDALNLRNEPLLWRLAHCDRQEWGILWGKGVTYPAPPSKSLNGSLISNASLVWSPPLSPPSPHRTGRQALARKKQWERRIWGER